MLFFRKKDNNEDYTIRETLLLNDDSIAKYVAIICFHNNFSVNLVLLDEKMKPIKKIMELSEESHITKIEDKFYVFTIDGRLDKVFVFNDSFKQPLDVVNLGKLGISSVCSNDTNLYVYSGEKDEILLLDTDFNILSSVPNRYSKTVNRNQTIKSVVLTCSSEDFFSLPRFIPDSEEQYLVFKRILEENTKSTDNILVNSCAYDEQKRLLFIAMRNIVFVVDENLGFDYISFGDNSITNIYYDNKSNKLVVSAMNGKFKPVVLMLSDTDIKRSLSNNKNNREESLIDDNLFGKR